VKLIPITTPEGTFKVWTKRVGTNPRIKVLLLHGGPGATHEYFEAFDSYFPKEGIEYYYYDQLGSAFSDQPEDPRLWDLPRFVEEVEQVRVALHLDSSNFYLLGHSWGGILAMEYALKYPQHLKGLIVSNMMASIPAYVDYAEQVLMPAMDQNVLAEIKRIEAAKDYENPRYMELLVPNYYALHILRMPPDQWPDPVNRAFALHPDAGTERDGRLGEAREVGPHGRPRRDYGAHPDRRWSIRHHGSEAHGVDGGPVPARHLPRLSERQPHGDGRRPADLHERPDRLVAGDRRGLTRRRGVEHRPDRARTMAPAARSGVGAL
jgi:proline-specific peptidase